MLVKTVLVFLGLMVLVAMLGRAFFPAATSRVLRKAVPKAVRCGSCGRYLVGRGDCACKKKA